MINIEGLLRRKIGLDAASIGSSLIERTVRLRMKSVGVTRIDAYRRMVESSRAELEALIEAIVVRETWFFRDHVPFEVFGQLAVQWIAAHPSGTLRALSVPCSSGEEPYSMAMALLDQNVPSHRFVIDAADISTHALERAKQALYGRNSFRSKQLAFRERFFHPQDGAYALNSCVRECVKFFQANLLDENFLSTHPPYDFIFCRNLLIYFDRATQTKALERIRRLLVPDGLLFVGPAEMPLATDNGFLSANLPMAFACRKKPTAGILSRPRTQTRNSLGSKPILPPPPQSPGAEILENQSKPARTVVQPPSELDAARQLADAGRLEEAREICERHLKKSGPCAEAYYLLGLVCDASNDHPQAIEFYRKAIYLDPSHYESLMHMSLLLEKTGDTAGARAFKRRAHRVQAKN